MIWSYFLSSKIRKTVSEWYFCGVGVNGAKLQDKMQRDHLKGYENQVS